MLGKLAATTAGAAVLPVVAQAASGGPIADLLLSEYGPAAVVLLVLYRKVDRIDTRLDDMEDATRRNTEARRVGRFEQRPAPPEGRRGKEKRPARVE